MCAGLGEAILSFEKLLPRAPGKAIAHPFGLSEDEKPDKGSKGRPMNKLTCFSPKTRCKGEVHNRSFGSEENKKTCQK
jgi:hypothetical protein